MKKLLYLFVPVILLLFGECKKVTKKVNSEKMFSLIFVDSLNAPINQCYDRVWARDRANLSNCSNGAPGLQLPLSIRADSSIFFFHKNSKTDTLILIYNKTIAPGTTEFEIFYDITQIKGSFKKPNTDCISNLTPSCDGNKALLSAVIYQ